MSNPERPSHVWDCQRMLRVRCPDVVDNNTPKSGAWSIGSMRTRLKPPATRLLSLLVAVMPMLANALTRFGFCSYGPSTAWLAGGRTAVPVSALAPRSVYVTVFAPLSPNAVIAV